MYKHEDKMGIHRMESNGKVWIIEITSQDYFWNYFYLGMDILLDGDHHIVKKIILHANYLHHYEAMHYERCYFQFGIFC